MNLPRLTRGRRNGQAPAATPRLTTKQVWDQLGKASFAVISHVNPAGKPRASGVVYATTGRRLYVVVAAESWKARQISDGDEVAVTVPIRRGGLLTLVLPIPPATVSCHARATVHPAGPLDVDSMPRKLARLLPRERTSACLVELVPEGRFLTYGLGVSLRGMADPATARAHVSVD